MPTFTHKSGLNFQYCLLCAASGTRIGGPSTSVSVTSIQAGVALAKSGSLHLEARHSIRLGRTPSMVRYMYAIAERWLKPKYGFRQRDPDRRPQKAPRFGGIC